PSGRFVLHCHLSLNDNQSHNAAVLHPLLLWRRGQGRGGLTSSNPAHWLIARQGALPVAGVGRSLVLLSPALSSKGGAGEPRLPACKPNSTTVCLILCLVFCLGVESSKASPAFD